MAPSFALELLRVATGQPQYTVQSDREGINGVQIGTSFIPTDSDGRIRLHFSPAYAARRVSARAILRGEVASNAFANQDSDYRRNSHRRHRCGGHTDRERTWMARRSTPSSLKIFSPGHG